GRQLVSYSFGHSLQHRSIKHRTVMGYQGKIGHIGKESFEDFICLISTHNIFRTNMRQMRNTRGNRVMRTYKADKRLTNRLIVYVALSRHLEYFNIANLPWSIPIAHR